MPKFRVRGYRIIGVLIDVEAESKDEALGKAWDMDWDELFSKGVEEHEFTVESPTDEADEDEEIAGGRRLMGWDDDDRSWLMGWEDDDRS